MTTRHAKANHCDPKKDRFGLGYKSDKRERQRLVEEKKEKRIASFLGRREKMQKWTYHR